MAEQEYKNQPTQEPKVAYLPDFCSTSAVVALVLVGELLAFALVLADGGVAKFSWVTFGLISLLIQWVLLASAATICIARRWLDRVSPASAVSISYSIVIAYTVLFSFFSALASPDRSDGISLQILTNVLIAAIFAGVLFRYLFIQQKLKAQEQAELNARVQALQSRIRPHFLFNSLNSIASLIAIKPDLAEKTVIDLSQLFRASLQLPQLIPIDQELALCRCFVDIERVRLGERLKVHWQVDQLSSHTLILNLLLQPLLENAIYHGIQPLKQGGLVKVEVKPVKHDLVLRVTNPYTQTASLKHKPTDEVEEEGTRKSSVDKPGTGNGIALSNIRDRLAAMYGKSAHLRVVKGEGEFCVVVRYPLNNRSE